MSRVTIRSDFNSLAEKGLILRTRGGAFPAFHPTILERQRSNVEAKQRIAEAAAAMIQDSDTVMINDGTTSSMIPRYLLGKQGVNIVTNSSLLFSMARVNPSLHLTLVGGEFRPESEAIVGPMALRDLENFHVKYVFVGTGGFSLETGLTTHLPEGAEVLRKMTALGEKIVLVADSSKYGKDDFVRILPLELIHLIITDSRIDPHIAQNIRELGIELEIVEI